MLSSRRLAVCLGLLLSLALLLTSCAGGASGTTPSPESKAKPTTTGETKESKPNATGAAPTAAPQAAASSKTDTVKVGYMTLMSHGALFVAQERGYWKEQNLNVDLQEFKNGGDMIPFLSTGDLDAAAGSSGAALLNAFQSGVDAKIVATMNTQPEGDGSGALVVRKSDFDSGKVKTPADLKGKKYGMNGKGVSGEILAEKALQGGLTLKDVDVVTMGFPDLIAALSNGAVDAVYFAEPYATQAVEMGIGYKLVTKVLPGDQIQLLLYGEKFMKGRQDVANRFMVGYIKAIRELAKYKWKDDADIAAVAKWTKLNPDIIKKAVAPGQDPNGRLNEKSLEDQQTWYMSHNYLKYKDPINIRQYIDYTFADYAVKQLGEFKP